MDCWHFDSISGAGRRETRTYSTNTPWTTMWDAAQWTGQVRLIQACHPVPTSVLLFDIWIRTRFGDALTYFRYQRFNTSVNACASLGFSDTMGPHPSIARASAAQSHNFTPERDKWLPESGREDTWFAPLSPQAWVRQYARHISACVGTSVRPVRQFVGTSVRQVHRYVREHAPLLRGLQELWVLVGACVEERTGHV